MNPNGNLLSQSATCRICHEVLILPKPTPLIGADQKQQEMGAGFMALMQHLTTKHADLKPVSLVWSAMFAEYFCLAMFDTAGALQEAKDVKRVQLLRVCQRKPPENLTADLAARQWYEETALCAELEAAGYKLASDFLGGVVHIQKSTT